MNQAEQMREALRREFPLLDEIGLDQELHHCEWSIQQERKRLHQLLDELQAEQALSHVNQTPKNEHDSAEGFILAADPASPEPVFHNCTFNAGPKLVRLTDREVFACFDKQNTGDDAQRNVLYFAHAIMDAMQEKNK